MLPAAAPQGQAVFELRFVRVTHSFESHSDSVSVYAAPCSVLYWRVGGASIFPQGRHAFFLISQLSAIQDAAAAQHSGAVLILGSKHLASDTAQFSKFAAFFLTLTLADVYTADPAIM